MTEPASVSPTERVRSVMRKDMYLLTFDQVQAIFDNIKKFDFTPEEMQILKEHYHHLGTFRGPQDLGVVHSAKTRPFEIKK